MKQVVDRSQTITANTTLMPEGFSGWVAQNIGTGDAKVNGFVLSPGDKLDFSHLEFGVIWNSPIVVEVASGGAIRIMRLQYNS